jgi:hypothetical protein
MVIASLVAAFVRDDFAPDPNAAMDSLVLIEGIDGTNPALPHAIPLRYVVVTTSRLSSSRGQGNIISSLVPGRFATMEATTWRQISSRLISRTVMLSLTDGKSAWGTTMCPNMTSASNNSRGLDVISKRVMPWGSERYKTKDVVAVPRPWNAEANHIAGQTVSTLLVTPSNAPPFPAA